MGIIEISFIDVLNCIGLHECISYMDFNVDTVMSRVVMITKFHSSTSRVLIVTHKSTSQQISKRSKFFTNAFAKLM